MEANKNEVILTNEELKLINKYRAVKDDDVKFSINLILDMANAIDIYQGRQESLT